MISVRAFNGVGDGQPRYESNRTREESTPEPVSPLIPPVGLKAIVLSATSVVVYWTDTTLSQSQVKFCEVLLHVILSFSNIPKLYMSL